METKCFELKGTRTSEDKIDKQKQEPRKLTGDKAELNPYLATQDQSGGKPGDISHAPQICGVGNLEGMVWTVNHPGLASP